MQITQRKIIELIPADYNPRKIDKNAFEQLKISLESFKCVEPAVINTNPDRLNIIVGGHQRIKAAKALKWKDFPCIELDLTLEEEKELNIRLNKNTGEFDFDMLVENFEIEDLVQWGFDEDELGLDDIEEVGEVEGEDDVPEAPEKPITVLGDVWTLGDHRLVCGDSTSITDVDKLMDGNKADMVFTDPPYGMSYGGGRAGKVGSNDGTVKKHGVILGDELRGDGLIGMISDSISAAKISAKSGAALYICFPWRTYSEFEAALLNIDVKPSACIVWDKKSIGLGNANYRPQHEFIFYIKGGTWHGDKSQSDVWHMSRGATGAYVHPTQKPVELIEKAIHNSSKSGDYIHDCFGGSGSTLIACEKAKRKCFMMELDEKYCDVIIKRWQEFTGKEAVNENGKTYQELAS